MFFQMTPLIEFKDSIPVTLDNKMTPNATETKTKSSSGNTLRRPVPEEGNHLPLVVGTVPGHIMLKLEPLQFPNFTNDSLLMNSNDYNKRLR